MGNRTQLLALATALMLAGLAEAQELGRIRHTEGQVTLQRSGESIAEEASPNSPFLPGDRLWSGASGRVELQLPNGAFLWLDCRSRLEYADAANEDSAAIGIESGSLHVRTADDAVAIDTPDGRVDIDQDAELRIDVTTRGTAVAVTRGEARLNWGGESTDVSDGTRVWFRRGVGPGREEQLDRSALDAFGLWVEERQGQRTRGGESARYLPAELTSYSDEFDTYGSWAEEPSVGYVWHPTVEAGWAPYSNGHWVWTAYGYTWVPYEPWGWTVSHYGRWGFSAGQGWYWMPGRRWGPAWVSWAVGGSYVGWSPMDRHDRPIHSRAYRNGRDDWRSWRFVRSHDLTDRHGAHRGVDIARTPDFDGRSVRIVSSPAGRGTGVVRSFRTERPLDPQGVVRRGSSPSRREGDASTRIEGFANRSWTPTSRASSAPEVRERSRGDVARRNGVTYREATPDSSRANDSRGEAATARSRSDRTGAQGDEAVPRTWFRPFARRDGSTRAREERETSAPTARESSEQPRRVRRDDSSSGGHRTPPPPRAQDDSSGHRSPPPPRAQDDSNRRDGGRSDSGRASRSDSGERRGRHRD